MTTSQSVEATASVFAPLLIAIVVSSVCVLLHKFATHSCPDASVACMAHPSSRRTYIMIGILPIGGS